MESWTAGRWITFYDALFVYLHIVEVLAYVHQLNRILGDLNLSNFRFDLLLDPTLFVFNPKAGKVGYNQATKRFMLRHSEI